jgi:hypothetical protein
MDVIRDSDPHVKMMDKDVLGQSFSCADRANACTLSRQVHVQCTIHINSPATLVQGPSLILAWIMRDPEHIVRS